MKRLLLPLIGLVLLIALFPFMASAQNSSLWKFVGTLRPNVSTWRVDAPAGFSGSTVTMGVARSCAFGVVTNSAGKVTGCASGGGSVNTGAILDAANGRFVNVSGDTMTGSLHILNGKNLQVAGSITGSTVRAVSGLYSSGALSVDADGMFAAGNTTTVTVRRETTGQFASYTLNSAGTDIASFQIRNDSTNDVYLRDVANGRTWLKLVTNGIVKAPAGLSGATLRSDGVMTVSGALVLESSLTGATLFGFGLPAGGCSNGTTSKLLWNAATGMLSCGTDTDTNTQWSGTGALQNFFDNRYVNTSGDTMTGKLLINLSSGTDALEVVQTASASTLHANVLLRSSGSLVTESGAYIAGTSLVVISASNQVGMGTAQPAADLHITDDDSRTEIILDNTAANGDPIINFRLPGTAQWVVGLDDSNGDAFVISAGSSLGSSDRFAITQAGLVGIGTTSPDTALEVIGTASGAVVYAKDSLRSSGSLVWEGAGSGATLTVSGQLDGAGLADCDTAGTSKLLWDATTKRFSCGTDTDTNTTYTAGKGLTLTSTAFSTNDTQTGTMLRFLTVSGALVYAKNSLSSSGAVTWEGAGSGAALYIGGTFDGVGLVDCDTAGTSKLLWDATTKRFSCGTDQNTGGGGGAFTTTGALQTYFDNRFVNQSGDTMTGALTINVTGGNINTIGLKVINTFSGAIVQATQQLRSSGSIITETGGYIGGTSLPPVIKRTVILTGGGAIPSTTSGSVTKSNSFSTNAINIISADFVGTGSLRYAQWTATMPDSYDGGTLTAVFSWVPSASITGGTKNSVKWYLQCQAYGSGSTIDSSWGTAVGVAGTMGAGQRNILQQTAPTAAITCGGTPAGGKLLQFRAYRDPADGSDTFAGTGKLISVKAEYTVSSHSD